MVKSNGLKIMEGDLLSGACFLAKKKEYKDLSNLQGGDLDEFPDRCPNDCPKSPEGCPECLAERRKRCWEYKASVDGEGYGNAWLNGKNVKAHRLSHALFNGPVSEGDYVCHTCDNRCCVNPNHLYLGDAKTNAQDRVKRKKAKEMQDAA